MNEDNIGSDLAKHKRGAYKRNGPEEKLVNPPWWGVQADGYGGLNSMGALSEEGASGAYLFTCLSTGSTDIRLYASHHQFPIALHQFLVRVQAEFWTCRVIYMDTHSVNLSADVEEVLAGIVSSSTDSYISRDATRIGFCGNTREDDQEIIYGNVAWSSTSRQKVLGSIR